MSRHLAIDLGAESGRLMLGTLAKGRLRLREIHRFANGAVSADGTLRWDILRIFREVRLGLAKAAKAGPVDSLACDSWGVDYTLLRGDGPPLSLPYTYRDERTFRSFAETARVLPPKAAFAATGIAPLSINTLYQLADDVRNRPEILRLADRFLLIGDTLSWLLSGVSRAEETLVSGSQLWDTRRRRWAWPIIAKAGIPRRLFPKVVRPGTRLGKLRPELARETGLRRAMVVATCAHDTAAAVAAVPAGRGDDWAYLSSGTWSLLGVELPRPRIDAAALRAGFTNETGYAGTTRFLKNLVGLWVLQECRREWRERGEVADYGEITRLAAAARPLRSLLRLDDARFLRRGDMVAKVRAYCRETGQPAPRAHGEVARAILESLALLYRVELDALERLAGRRLATLHIVGGGSRNALLNQAAADATGRTVVAGPVEATAAGNILVQAAALGEVRGLAGIREVVRASFPVATFAPRPSAAWDLALRRFRALPAR
jgi:rhamnulokinase